MATFPFPQFRPGRVRVRLWLLACLLLLQQAVSAQSPSAQPPADVRISGEFAGRPLQEVLPAVEAQAAAQGHPIHFFYDSTLAAGQSVAVRLVQEPLASALDKLLAGTPLGFYGYNAYYFVLLRRADLQELSPADSGQAPAAPLVEADDPAAARSGMTLRGARRGARTLALGGILRDASSRKPLEGATIYVEELRSGVLSDKAGGYVLNLPAGVYNLVFSYVGYQSRRRQLTVRGPVTLNMDLLNADIRLREVTVTAEAADRNVSNTQMSITKLSIRTIRKMPPLMGEVDIVRSILLLPGVSSVGEGSTGFNVRGGGIDQNLVLMDNAPIYNSSHMFGLFSVFNPDIVKDVTLHRGGISARFGGRASSVLDIQLKDANAPKLRFNGGIGLVSSRLSVEAPLVKDKVSFIVAGRGSFTDFLLKSLPNPSLRNTRANFYDLNAKVDFRLGTKNTLSLSGYASDDLLQINADSILTIAVNSAITQYRWSNRYGTLKWQRYFSEKLSGSASATYSRYAARITNPTEPNQFDIPTQLNQLNLNADAVYQYNEKHRLSFGLQGIRYAASPENLVVPPSSDVNPISIPREQGMEGALYVEDDFVVNPAVTLTAGLRLSGYLSTGPATVTRYQPGAPRDPITALDTAVYGRGDVARAYGGFEPRLALKVSTDENSSVKLSYNRMRQYIHLISNTAAAIPTARWQLSNTHIRPQLADQVAAGYFRNFNGNQFETSVEVYYKKLHNFLDYKDNGVVFLNRNIENAVLQGEGRAYGVEVLARKNIGEYLTGWLSYTYARTWVRMASPRPGEQVNEGDWYPANFDKPHTVNLVLNYQVKKRIGFSANYTYSTGRPVTYPESKFVVGNLIVPDFGLRNQFRIPDYHRLDIAVNIDSGYRKRKKVDKSWTFAVYNLYSRNNAYSVFFRPSGGSANAYKLSIFGAAFPSLTYNFRF